MYKTKMLCIIALLMSIAVVIVTPATAAEVSVTRVLPDTVYPGQEFNVNLTQSGFLFSVGSVTETLPEGFEFKGVLSGGKLYDRQANVFTMDFEGGETTLIYSLKAGTKEQIEAAEFSEGTWTTMVDSESNIIDGPVTGHTELTFVADPTPTPTLPSGNGGSNGGGGGTGGDGGVTATPVASPTSTAGETPKHSPSPAAGATETPAATTSPAETAAPSTSPTTTAAGKTPGFDAIFAIAGLLSVAYLVLSRRRKA